MDSDLVWVRLGESLLYSVDGKWVKDWAVQDFVLWLGTTRVDLLSGGSADEQGLYSEGFMSQYKDLP